MKRFWQFISLIALLLTIVPPVLFFRGDIAQEQQNWYMLAGAVAWFISALFWLGKRTDQAQ